MVMLDTETEIKSLWRALDGNIEELTKRLDALEQRVRPPIPIVTPLARSALHGDITQHGLAPAPDYRSGLPAEVEPCSCDESVALRDEVRLLRAELGSASLELRQMAGRAEAAEAVAEARRATVVGLSKENESLRADLQVTLDDLNRKIGLLQEARAEVERLQALEKHHLIVIEATRRNRDDRLADASALLSECFHYQARLPQDCVRRLSRYLALEGKGSSDAPKSDAAQPATLSLPHRSEVLGDVKSGARTSQPEAKPDA